MCSREAGSVVVLISKPLSMMSFIARGMLSHPPPKLRLMRSSSVAAVICLMFS